MSFAYRYTDRCVVICRKYFDIDVSCFQSFSDYSVFAREKHDLGGPVSWIDFRRRFKFHKKTLKIQKVENSQKKNLIKKSMKISFYIFCISKQIPKKFQSSRFMPTHFDISYSSTFCSSKPHNLFNASHIFLRHNLLRFIYTLRINCTNCE